MSAYFMSENIKLEQKWIDLETRYLYQENTIEQLNQVVIEQQKQITDLKKTIEIINKNLKSLLERADDIRPHEKPPHY
jgi:SlyX protein